VTLTISYDYLQVTLSAIIAVSASYAALDLAGRVTAASGWPRLAWFAGGATAMGIGIWSTHFTAMLAFRLPIPIRYHWPTVLLSLMAGLVSSAFALYIASRKEMGPVRALNSSVIMGIGIAALHYIAMAAMRLAAAMHFNPFIVALAVLFGVNAEHEFIADKGGGGEEFPRPQHQQQCRRAFHAAIPVCLSSARTSGSRPRNRTKASIASKLPPLLRIESRKRVAVAPSNTPACSNASNASAARTSAHL